MYLMLTRELWDWHLTRTESAKVFRTVWLLLFKPREILAPGSLVVCYVITTLDVTAERFHVFLCGKFSQAGRT